MVPHLNIKEFVTEKCESKNATGSEKLLEPIGQIDLVRPKQGCKNYIVFFIPCV